MITNIRTYVTDTTNPHHNLAIEEYLLYQVKQNECILYLWQNRHTVVIGRNQNCWKECKVNELEEDGGYLARRLSGGGAVYHDLGNLNFTFLVNKEDYDVDRQLQVIQEAVASFGITVEKSGRNDLTIQGRKFSGNAFFENKGKCYHHGTLLICVDVEQMSRFLSVSQDKLKSKGVDSVRSRVDNLSNMSSEITVGIMKEHLIMAFEKVYGCKATSISEAEIDWKEVAGLEEKNASWQWRCGRRIPFTHEFSRRFSWGNIEFQIQVNEGVIQELSLDSDSMESRLYILEQALKGCPYQRKAVLDTLNLFMNQISFPLEIQKDICMLVAENLD